MFHAVSQTSPSILREIRIPVISIQMNYSKPISKVKIVLYI